MFTLRKYVAVHFILLFNKQVHNKPTCSMLQLTDSLTLILWYSPEVYYNIHQTPKVRNSGKIVNKIIILNGQKVLL